MAKLTASEYKLLDRMNKRLRTWHKNNLSNEVVNQIQNDLLNFYTKHNIDNPSRDIILFKKSSRYTDEEKQEILQIAKAMDRAKSSKISYYRKHKVDDLKIRKSFESMRQNPAYNINSFSDYIQLVDDLNNAKAIIAELMEIDSGLVARTYSYAREHKLTSEEVNKILVNTLKNYRDGDTMEQFLQTEIERKELSNYINLNLRDSVTDYAQTLKIETEIVDQIINDAIRDNIKIDEIEQHLYDMVDKYKK